MTGAGTDMWANSDNGEFAYKQLTGNGTIIAKVTSQQVTDANCKAGIMMRDTLDASSNCIALWAKSGVPVIESFQRIAPSAGTAYTDQDNTSDGITGTIALPYWLKLTRSGDQFWAFSSSDAVTWSPLNNAGVGRNIPMGSTIYVGLCVTSRVNATLSTATFTNVGIDTTGGSLNNGTYKIVNRNSGKVLDVSGSLDADNIPVLQMPYSGGLNELWSFTNVGGGKYRIIGVDSNKALTVPGSSTSDGTGIAIWTYNPTANNQRWFMTATDSGYSSVKVERASKAMQVRGASTADGAVIEQGTYSGLNSQQWTFQSP